MFFMNRNKFCYFEHRSKDTCREGKIKNIRKSFSILVGKLLGPVDLFQSREDMILIISYLSVGPRKRDIGSVSRKIRKVLMGIINTFFSFSSNGSK